jgi:hypothetical protein
MRLTLMHRFSLLKRMDRTLPLTHGAQRLGEYPVMRDCRRLRANTRFDLRKPRRKRMIGTARQRRGKFPARHDASLWKLVE